MDIALLLSQIFKSMPASVVKSIEVITNPEAKYNVEGAVGIPNLVMNAPRGGSQVNGYARPNTTTTLSNNSRKPE